MQVDTSGWSGEGQFTALLLERLRALEQVEFIRVEDAPATRSEADYQFLSNEVFVRFTVVTREERFKRLRLLPARRKVSEKVMTMRSLESALTAMADVGAPDYSDESMLQYLRTERIIPPYQTRGYKLVELVRIYEVGAAGRS